MRVAGLRCALAGVTCEKSFGRLVRRSALRDERSLGDEMVQVPPPAKVCWFLRTKGRGWDEILRRVPEIRSSIHWRRAPVHSWGTGEELLACLHVMQHDSGAGMRSSSSRRVDLGLGTSRGQQRCADCKPRPHRAFIMSFSEPTLVIQTCTKQLLS